MDDLFGTDGVRGEANEDLTPDLAVRLGRACNLLASSGEKVVVGRDTRRSGAMLQSGLICGLASVGLEVLDLGVIPTPAVAELGPRYEAKLGAVVSASHNRPEDNGIKFFDEAGFKISEEAEDRLQQAIMKEETPSPAHPCQIGKVDRVPAAEESYLDYLRSNCWGVSLSLEGLKVAVDCAHGATHRVAPRLLRSLGASVAAVNDRPTGDNINLDCGSTNPRPLQELVAEESFDLGVAYDGDGDRAVFVDSRGKLIDGDAVLYSVSNWYLEEGLLDPPLVVSTVMSNYGLEKSLDRNGINLVRTSVGDRYVAQRMQSSGALLGGEQSGHVIFGDSSVTGDGLITTLKVLTMVVRSEKTFPQLLEGFERYPQVLENVETDHKGELSNNGTIGEAVAKWEVRLGAEGRILVRPSGTQPVVRVMVEGKDRSLISEAADDLSRIVCRELNEKSVAL